MVSIRYKSYKNNVPESQNVSHNQEAQLNKAENTSTIAYTYYFSFIPKSYMIKKYPDKWILRKKVFLWVTSHYHGEIKEAGT